MKLEIERKFLVRNEHWRDCVTATLRLRDGLIADYAGRKVRVRICNGAGSITLKGRRDGLARSEFTYDVPLHEAEDLLRTMCDDRVIEKIRYVVLHEGFTWSVDVYQGNLNGVIIAEIELEAQDQPFALPDWIGREVTIDSHFRKVNLLSTLKSGGY